MEAAPLRPPVGGVLEPALYVEDLERAAAFYERVFGLPLLVGDARLRAYDVAGRQVLIDYLKQRARPYLFSSAATAADVAACIAAVELLQQSQDNVAQLWDNTRFFQEHLRALGFDLGHTQTPITPVMIGDAQRARILSAQLFNAGVFVQAVAFPTVPRDTARLRVMLSATHTREDLEFALETFGRIGQACQVNLHPGLHEGLGRRFQPLLEQSLGELGILALHGNARQTTVDHGGHALNRDRAFGHVGCEDQLGLAGRLYGPVLERNVFADEEVQRRADQEVQRS